MKIYVVGGAVRDLLLGLQPKDFDYVVVDGSAKEMLDLGFKQVGADFPVFLHPKTNEEYALARVERKTGDGYLGFSVKTEGVTLEEDLSRRDLTINAMAIPLGHHAHPLDSLIDPFNGQHDLKMGILRHVSDAFSEDPLRVLRVARFYTRYENFVVAEDTQVLCKRLVRQGQLNELSVERFWQELKKVFAEQQPARFFDLLYAFGGHYDIKFFSELYRIVGPESLNFAKQFAVKWTPSPEMNLMLHTAFTADAGAMLDTADTATKKLHAHVVQWSNSQASVGDLFELLKNVKAFSGDRVQYSNLMRALELSEAVSQPRGRITAHQLGLGMKAGSAVTAADFPDVKGKELGEKIEQARKAAIRQTL